MGFDEAIQPKPWLAASLMFGGRTRDALADHAKPYLLKTAFQTGEIAGVLDGAVVQASVAVLLGQVGQKREKLVDFLLIGHKRCRPGLVLDAAGLNPGGCFPQGQFTKKINHR